MLMIQLSKVHYLSKRYLTSPSVIVLYRLVMYMSIMFNSNMLLFVQVEDGDTPSWIRGELESASGMTCKCSCVI